jgi:hypothetical protein
MSNSDLERNRPRFPRIIAAGVDYNDLMSIVQRCEVHNEDWGKVWEEFAMVTHAKSLDEAEKIAKTFTLKGIMEKVKVPLLIVHSQGDVVCRYEEAERMARETGGAVQLALYPEGNHVCDNIPYKVRPMMGDWLARQLGLSAGSLQIQAASPP